MRVEGRGLEYFRERQLHFIGERSKVRGGDLMISVLDQMQMLDQEIASARAVTEQLLDLGRSLWIDLTAFRRRFAPPPSLTGMIEGPNLLHVMIHRKLI